MIFFSISVDIFHLFSSGEKTQQKQVAKFSEETVQNVTSSERQANKQLGQMDLPFFT